MSSTDVYRLTVARTIATTWGDPIDETQWVSPIELAKNHPQHAAIQAALDSSFNSWQSAPGLSATQAAEAAKNDLADQLQSALAANDAQIVSDPVYYVPIYDENGNPIGHQFVGLLLVDGQTLHFALPPRPGFPSVEGLLTVFIGVGLQ